MDMIVKYLSKNISEREIIKLILKYSSNMTADILLKNQVIHVVQPRECVSEFYSSIYINNKLHYVYEYIILNEKYNYDKNSCVFMSENNMPLKYLNTVKIINEHYNKQWKKTNINCLHSSDGQNFSCEK